VHDPAAADFAEDAFLLAALKCSSGPCLEVRLDGFWEGEGWEDEGEAVGGCGLEFAFCAVADVDF